MNGLRSPHMSHLVSKWKTLYTYQDRRISMEVFLIGGVRCYGEARTEKKTPTGFAELSVSVKQFGFNILRPGSTHNTN
jgi:hypothetical protein